MTPARATAFRWDDIPLERVTEMVARKVVIADGQMMAQTYLKKGAIVRIDCEGFGGEPVGILRWMLTAGLAG